jgi:hypothetical protein
MEEKKFFSQYMTKHKIIGSIAILFLLLLLALGSILVRFYDSIDCADLPTVIEVEETLQNHAELIEQVKQVNPGYIHVSIVSPRECPGKGYLVIAYATIQNKTAIQELFEKEQGVNNKQFFGVPYFLRNV